jgi:hypothetical protein
MQNYKPKYKATLQIGNRTIEAEVPSLIFDEPGVGIMDLPKMNDLNNDMRRAVHYLHALQNENPDAALMIAHVLSEAHAVLGGEIRKVVLKAVERHSLEEEPLEADQPG